MISHVGKVLWERGHVPDMTITGNGGSSESPKISWEFIIMIVNYFVFIPVLLLVSLPPKPFMPHTLSNTFPDRLHL